MIHEEQSICMIVYPSLYILVGSSVLDVNVIIAVTSSRALQHYNWSPSFSTARLYLLGCQVSS